MRYPRSSISNLQRPVRQKKVRCRRQDVHVYPVSAIGHGLALNITLISYLDQLDFGLIACRDTLPDIEKLADNIVDQFEELKRAVERRRANGKAVREKSRTKSPAQRAQARNLRWPLFARATKQPTRQAPPEGMLRYRATADAPCDRALTAEIRTLEIRTEIKAWSAPIPAENSEFLVSGGKSLGKTPGIPGLFWGDTLGARGGRGKRIRTRTASRWRPVCTENLIPLRRRANRVS